MPEAKATKARWADMENYFQELTSLVDSEREPEERFLLNFYAESSDFARFNDNRIVQAGHVTQIEVSIDLISGSRHAAGSMNLSGDLSRDWEPLNQMLNALRGQREEIGEDPYLYFATDPTSSRLERKGSIPTPEEALKHITQAGEGLDLVGIYAAGDVFRGFANHLGQSNWYQARSFNFDWSCFARADKAVKARYAGAEWRHNELDRCMEQVRKHLELMQVTPKTLQPGRYRAYLSPAAMNDILDLLAWGGFDLKAHRCRTTALLKLAEHECELAPSISIMENTAGGFGANFTAEGFMLPEQVQLIENGKLVNCLADARSAREYGETVNARSGSPENLEMAPGNLSQQTILEELGTGIYVGNVHYLNYSDRNDCRITGMTRFACFWVEGGKIIAPINVMRFDDSIYQLLGPRLIGLTRERSLIMDAGSYYNRSTASCRLPGALVDGLKLTL